MTSIINEFTNDHNQYANIQQDKDSILYRLVMYDSYNILFLNKKYKTYKSAYNAMMKYSNNTMKPIEELQQEKKHSVILYPDTEKELTFDDYKPIRESLKNHTIDELEGLLDNLQAAYENTFIYHSELLSIAINQDIEKVNVYLKFAYRKQERKETK